MKNKIEKLLKCIRFILLIVLVIEEGKAAAQQNVVLNSYSGQTEIKASESITLKDGFYIPAGNSVRLYIDPNLYNCVPFASTPSSNQNYISTKIFKIPGVFTDNDVNAAGRSTCDVNQVV